MINEEKPKLTAFSKYLKNLGENKNWSFYSRNKYIKEKFELRNQIYLFFFQWEKLVSIGTRLWNESIPEQDFTSYVQERMTFLTCGKQTTMNDLVCLQFLLESQLAKIMTVAVDNGRFPTSKNIQNYVCYLRTNAQQHNVIEQNSDKESITFSCPSFVHNNML